MKRNFLSMAVMMVSLLVLFGLSWSQCPEDPADLGDCDTLHVIPWGTDTCFIACNYMGICDTICINNPGEEFPRFLYVPLLVTHDSNTFWWDGAGKWVQDSIANFVIPLTWDHTNPSAYCSLSTYWNENQMLYFAPQFPRSIWRHFHPEEFDSNRMAWLAAQFQGLEWSATLNIANDSSWHHYAGDSAFVPPHMWLNVTPTVATNRRWWEGERTLFITLTFRIEDTMHVCIDSTWWPPSGELAFTRHDAVNYVPRHKLPLCMWIGPPRIEVTSPNGGETWAVGEIHDITWISEGSKADVTIEYSTNGGVDWDTVIASTPDDGAYSWTIPNTPSAECRVKVSDAADGDPSDISDSNFIISSPASITVTWPNGGELWCVDSTYNITWSSSGIDSVMIEYTTDGGTNWDTIVASIPAVPGTYGWTVPNTPSDSCLVRICDAEDDTLCDQSDTLFTILAPPATPSNCVASDTLCDKVHFCWQDNSNNEDGFNIYRNGSSIGAVGANVTCYDDTGATPGVLYQYCVTAYNNCGESDSCCDDGIRLAPPVAPSDCVASDNLCDKVQFCWQDNSDDETGFYIYRNGSKLDSVSADGTCYDDSSATPGVTYQYCVTAYNDCGESSPCCDSGTIALEAVTVTAPNGGENWIVDSTYDITWTSTCIESVKIEYSTDGGSSFTIIDTAEAKGSYSWQVPDTPSDSCLVRICDLGGSPCDTSDSIFSIVRPDFALDVEPDTLEIYPNTSDSFQVTLTSLYGFASPCTLSVTGLDSVGTGVFHPDTLTPTGTSFLVITDTTIQEGIYPVTITATEIAKAAQVEHDTVVYLKVLPTYEFTLYADPDTQSVAPGDSTTFEVWLIQNIPTNGPCILSVFNLPPGATGVFDPEVIDTDTSILTIATADTTPEDEYVIIIEAGCDQFKDTTEVTLIVQTQTDVDDEEGDQVNVPGKFALFQNQPNPFNPETEISYYLPQGCKVKLTIYNILGRRVKTLFEGYQTPGLKTLVWNGRDDQGGQLGSGIYFYRLQAGEFNQTRKMTLIK